MDEARENKSYKIFKTLAEFNSREILYTNPNICKDIFPLLSRCSISFHDRILLLNILQN